MPGDLAAVDLDAEQLDQAGRSFKGNKHLHLAAGEHHVGCGRDDAEASHIGKFDNAYPAFGGAGTPIAASVLLHHPPPSAAQSAIVSLRRAACAWMRAMRACW